MNPELAEAAKTAVYELLDRYNSLLNKSQAEPISKLEHWAEFLAIKKGFTVKQVAWSLTELTKNGSPFMPSAIEIAEKLAPIEAPINDRAPVIVAEMLRLINDFSINNEVKMLEKASPDAKIAFEALGNTRDIRMSENVETVKAQLERLVKGALRSKEAEAHMGQLLRLGIKPASPSLPENNMRRLDFGGELA